MINIDARRCGAGKTRGTNGIIEKINKLYTFGQSAIVVLPSLRIIEEYKNYLSNIDPIDIEFIDSRNSDNTSEDVMIAMGDRKQIIVITHQTFLMTQWLSGNKRYYNLIVDEEIIVTDESKLDQKKTSIINFFDSNISWLLPVEQCNIYAPEWRIMQVDKRILDNNYIAAFIRDLTDENWINWVEVTDYDRMKNGSTGMLNVLREVNPEIMHHWESVHIACAHFETTFMRYWLDAHNLPWAIIPGCEFVKHETPVTIHIPSLKKEITWSMNKIKTGHWLIDAYNEYIDGLKVEDEVFVLRNKKDDKRRVFDNETMAPFNAHGLNEYRHINKVSLEAAINLAPQTQRWHYAHWDMESSKTLIARTGNTFYQVLMRSCLRMNEHADIYSIDTRVGTDLLELYFDNIEYELFDLIDREPKTALTPAEKQRAYRQRQKLKKQKENNK